MQTAARLGDFHALHPVSAKTGDGDRRAARGARRAAARGAAVLPAPSSAPTSPIEEQIAELVREQALQLTREEVPHAITRRGRGDRREGRARVSMIVETESQKQILVGKGGSMVRKIGDAGAPADRARCSATRSTSSCTSRSRPNWRQRRDLLERFGIWSRVAGGEDGKAARALNGVASRMAARPQTLCHDVSVPTVLIVDDHPSFRASARAILEADGFEVSRRGRGRRVRDRGGRPPASGRRPARRAAPRHRRVRGHAPAAAERLRARRSCSSRAATAGDFGPLVESSGACGFVPKSELSGPAVAALICKD